MNEVGMNFNAIIWVQDFHPLWYSCTKKILSHLIKFWDALVGHSYNTRKAIHIIPVRFSNTFKFHFYINNMYKFDTLRTLLHESPIFHPFVPFVWQIIQQMSSYNTQICFSSAFYFYLFFPLLYPKKTSLWFYYLFYRISKRTLKSGKIA